MIEVEYKHRGPPDAFSRARVCVLNSSHFHRFYMLLRIYPRRACDGTFAAACMLWRKDTVHVPVLSPPVPPPAPTGDLLVWPAMELPTPAASPIANAALAAPIIGGILSGGGGMILERLL